MVTSTICHVRVVTVTFDAQHDVRFLEVIEEPRQLAYLLTHVSPERVGHLDVLAGHDDIHL